jgi:hypothetical protein
MNHTELEAHALRTSITLSLDLARSVLRLWGRGPSSKPFMITDCFARV